MDVGPSVVLVLVRRWRYQIEKMRMRASSEMVLAEDWEAEEFVHHLVLMHLIGSLVKFSLSPLSVGVVSCVIGFRPFPPVRSTTLARLLSRYTHQSQ